MNFRSRLKLTLFFAIIMALQSSAADVLYVFYPTVMRPAVLEDILKKACPTLEISVFGRYQDFKAKVEADHPQGILTKPQVLSQLSGYLPKLTGIRKGKNSERFVLISIDKPVNLASLDQKTIGVVDFLGRKGMDDFVKEILHTSPKINRVTKIEDLIPLLTFTMADAVLLNESNVSYFKKTSNLNFVITEIPDATAGILIFANNNSNAVDKNECIEKLPENVLVNLGIEQWK